MNFTPLETFLIAHPDHPEGIRINAIDFVPGVHVLWTEPVSEPPSRRKKKGDDLPAAPEMSEESAPSEVAE